MTSKASEHVHESETKGPHLCEDLESILKEKILEAPGAYAHSSLLPFGPQPCLNIEGLGNIGLPLSEPEAKRVITYASQAAYGQGSQTVINKGIRDTWEINASRVKFDNPDWLTFLQGVAIKAVCSSMRLKKYDTPPRCELYKLLIYEPGSRSLPHRDTQKADDMFATMTILLPSQYTGGEVHLTHASKTQVIDFSASSLVNAAVLAWYTGVLHEVKPVTSGYRLALSYNLIHTSPRFPLPIAPTYDGPCAELRRVLCKWKEGGYQQPEEHNCIAYLLKHRYSEADFSHGPSCLKGEDNERVALVRAIAEELGFVVLLGKIEYCVSINTYDSDSDHAESLYQRGRIHNEVDDDIYVDVSLSKVFDSSGHVVFDPRGQIKIGDDCFLPMDALDDDYPNDMNKWRHCGDEEIDIEYLYQRSVFVLLLSDQLPHVLIPSGGVGYVMKLFEESLSENAPSEKDRNMAKLIISKLSNSGKDKISAMKVMFNYAYKWEDIEMWQGLIERRRYDIGVQGENGLVRAWGVFNFDQTRASIEDLLRYKHLPNRLAFINAIRQALLESDDKDLIQDWCLNQVTVALESYVSPPDDGDISLLVSMACEDGIQSIRRVPIERIVPEKAFHFLTELVKALYPKRAVVLEKTIAHCAGSSDPRPEAAVMLDEFIRTCLHSAGKQWNVVTSWPQITVPFEYNINQQRQTRVINFIELCFLTCQMNTCRAFLDLVWNVSGEAVDKLNEIYAPLIPKLCKLLQKINIDVCAPPFIDFFRLLISHYLCYVLGTKEQQVQLRKIGCGCADCQSLDDFIVGTPEQYTFRVAQERSRHLKSRMDSAQDLVKYKTQRHGKLHHLVVSKTHAFLSTSMWEQRLQVVNNMFEAIGGDNVEKIMGDRYVDVCTALKGQGAFCLDKTVTPLQNAPGPASKSAVHSTTSVIGGKRKHD